MPQVSRPSMNIWVCLTGGLIVISLVVAFFGFRIIRDASEYHLLKSELNAQLEDASRILQQEELNQFHINRVLRDLQVAEQHAVACVELAEGPASWWPFRLIAPEDVERFMAHATQIREVHDLVKAGRSEDRVQFYFAAGLLGSVLNEAFFYEQRINEKKEQVYSTVLLYAAIVSALLMAAFALVARSILRLWAVTHERQVELSTLSRRFDLAMQASGEGIAIFDRSWRLISANRAYAETVHPEPDIVRPGIEARFLVEDSIRKGFYRDDAEFALAHERIRAGDWDEREDRILRNSDGRHVRLRYRETSEGDRVVTRADVTEFVETQKMLEIANAEITEIAFTDALTNLPNRRALETHIHENKLALGHFVRVDLDRFKTVNDTLGHDAGDHVLRVVADRLRDGICSNCRVYRVGGDEFTIWCCGQLDAADVIAMAERLKEALSEPVHFDGNRCLFGASFGIAEACPNGEAPSITLRNADVALYRAKMNGRARVQVFTPALRRTTDKRRALADSMITGLEEGQFLPHFQTQHCARTGSIVGLEALARWNHPEFGSVSPGVFLPIAAQLSLEADIDRAIMVRGLSDLSSLADDGLHVPAISFNCSAARLLHPGFLAEIDGAEIPDGLCVNLEVLETLSVEQEGHPLLYTLDAVRERGFRIHVDDFGSDHASVNTLLRIMPDAVKLDRALTERAVSSNAMALAIKPIIDLAHALEIRVIAEGVETDQQVRTLASIGSDAVQGFALSRPMPVHELAVFLDEQLSERGNG